MKNVFHLEPLHGIMELDRTETFALTKPKKLPGWNKFTEFLQKFWGCIQGTPDEMTPVKVVC
jgi:hypothetical protein